ncbi:MAG: GDSL-type esterase/lipase family protein [Ignavibacteriaceae bacterium]|nr:GDSL-type esterase/lipase family protein [Ignavibacteriaceae bacterium]
MKKTEENKKIRKNKSPFWFYLILFLIPILFFVFLEIFLRVINYGRNNDQWIKITEAKQMLNPDVAGRYFFATEDLPQSNNDAFDIVKRENAFRVFVMGGSSAQGFPFSPNGTFSRYIRDRLELIYPDKYIEVINLGITATNSYTIRDLLPDVIEQKPDLILIYAGHNEYYGAFGVGSTENIGNSRELVNFIIWLNKFKSLELMRNGITAIMPLFSSDAKQETHRGGTLMARIVKEQLIAFNSELYNVGIEQFEGNFEDILQMTKETGVPVLIGSLVSNLKDQKPFMSVGSDSNKNADSVYSKAMNQLTLGNTNQSDSLFRQAKDLDALRFRAPEKINKIIKKLVEKYNCGFINFDSIFNSNSPDGIVGNNLIVDHLHPSLSGYLLMGKAYFETMQTTGFLPDYELLPITDAQQDSIVTHNFAFSRLDSVISDIRLIGLLNDWPFVDKPDFSFIKKIKLDDRIDSIAYKIAVENMNWEKGHRDAAEFYFLKKDYLNFAKEFQVIVSQYPFKLNDYDYVTSQLINFKEYDFAYNFLLKRFKETPDAFSAKWLGNINLNNGKVDEAIKYLSVSAKYDKNDAQAFYNLAGAYIQSKDFKNALQSIEKCLGIKPDFPNAQKLRAQLLELSEQ